jgi:carboxyl-terminal processing protease
MCLKFKIFFALLVWVFLALFNLNAEENLGEATTRLPINEINNFTQVFEQIRTGYVKEITDTELLESAIEGMLSNLDPHSSYLNKKSYKSLKENATGAYGGLGVEVVGEKGAIRVIAPIDGGPASENDIRSGDLIVELDKSPVSKMNIQKAIDKLRGERGTEIELTILRDGEDRTITKTLIRDTIQISSVRGKLLYENFGYIRIAQFQISSDKDFVDEYLKLEQLNKKELDGLVLDLRNNPGGLVPPSISIADMLLTGGKIVYTEGRLPNSNQEYYADPFDISGGIPIIILINGGSASASEIVAGALQDNRRAVVIGTQSFGKGSVQTVVPINENSAIKLTTAKYFTPNGRSIQALGISPDLVIERAEIKPFKTSNRAREKNLTGHLNTESKGEKASSSQPTNIMADNQLYEALNILRGIKLLEK